MQFEFDKDSYKFYKNEAKMDGVTIASHRCDEWVDGYVSGYNGVTIAYAPMVDSPDARMLFVAVSYCAPEDEFKKKMGKFQVLTKFYTGEGVQLPLAQELIDYGHEHITSRLLGMFMV